MGRKAQALHTLLETQLTHPFPSLVRVPGSQHSNEMSAMQPPACLLLHLASEWEDALREHLRGTHYPSSTECSLALQYHHPSSTECGIHQRGRAGVVARKSCPCQCSFSPGLGRWRSPLPVTRGLVRVELGVHRISTSTHNFSPWT